MVAFPHCKINLGLRILSKRPDGYHNLLTCFYPVPWNDALEILPAKDLSFHQSGLVIQGNIDNNLCLKAYHLLNHEYKIGPVQIHLHKVIPTGAGLGGGSSDAAFTLRLLNSIFLLAIPESKLIEFGSRLGSDCPFFIRDSPQIGAGRGDQLEPVNLNLKGYFLRLIKPEVSISTAEAYSSVVPTDAPGISQILAKPETWKDELKNDFEKSVFKEYPLLEGLKKQLYDAGALYASMSGSGSSVYGIFRDKNLKKELSTRESWSGWL